MFSHFKTITILITCLLLSPSAYSAPKLKISNKTNQYLNNVKNCSGYQGLKAPADEYLECFSNTVKDSNFKGICIQGMIPTLLSLGCEKQFIADTFTSFMKDNVDYHKFEMNKMKETIKDFNDKGLSANFLLAKYANYANYYGIANELPLDPDMLKLKADNIEKAKTRKATCSDVMNLKEPLNLSNPSDQKGTGWCFAYTAADLLTHALGKRVSAVKASSMWYDTTLARIFVPGKAGGLVVTTLEESIEKGMCLEKDLPSTDHNFTRNDFDLNDLYRKVRELGKKYSPEKNMNTLDKKQVAEKKQYSKSEVLAELCSKNMSVVNGLHELFPHMSLDQFAEIMMKSGLDSFDKMVITCPLLDDPEIKKLVAKKEMNNDKIFPTIDEQLDKGNILGMIYKSNVTSDYTKRGVFPDHVSSIVGRRFNAITNSCDYLIRNSWGKTCSAYSEDYDCSNGHVWIPEDALKYRNPIFEVEYLEKK